ncbi:Hypothetical protein PHPALM_12202 [Phytophthora palmivora]|uniref:Uncharacterized protein n=1 Tax=Phytophthora palmivora TaxID=4796 RepID=A0A2P4Y0B2_9STRA|nr:Hypothetical protein PHPALM_12202 [Phytophthora palmivora]
MSRWPGPITCLLTLKGKEKTFSWKTTLTNGHSYLISVKRLGYDRVNVKCSAHTPDNLKPLYELLKGLLRAKLVSLPESPPQEESCGYQTLYRLQMAVIMTSRALRISAFVCSLGHFEWLRMSFGLKNAPMIYQRMIDNALWGYVQSKGGWAKFSSRIRRAEEVAATQRQNQGGDLTRPPSSLTKFAADNRALAELDPLQELIDSPEGDMFTCGESDQSVLTPVFTR